MNTGRTHFKIGMTPWNKGRKMYGKYLKNNRISHLGQIPWNKNPIKRICLVCQKEFTTNLFQINDGGGKYCSYKCYWRSLKGKPVRNIDGLKLGRLFKGEDHGNWRGGITPLRKAIMNHIKYEEWRKSIFERDNYTCQTCMEIGGILNADHITPYSIIRTRNNIRTVEDALNCKELWDLNNGRTLCVECHKKTETWGSHAYKFNKKEG